jgi:hypothetical protein
MQVELELRDTSEDKVIADLGNLGSGDLYT